MGAAAHVPNPRTGKIGFGFVVEDDMGQKAVAPLSFEQGPDFRFGPLHFQVAPSQGDKPGIPVPLKGIEPLTGDGKPVLPVVLQDFDGPGPQRFVHTPEVDREKIAILVIFIPYNNTP
jgi:hypothetical protein